MIIKLIAPCKGNTFIIKALICPFRARGVVVRCFVGRCPTLNYVALSARYRPPRLRDRKTVRPRDRKTVRDFAPLSFYLYFILSLLSARLYRASGAFIALSRPLSVFYFIAPPAPLSRLRRLYRASGAFIAPPAPLSRLRRLYRASGAFIALSRPLSVFYFIGAPARSPPRALYQSSPRHFNTFSVAYSAGRIKKKHF